MGLASAGIGVHGQRHAIVVFAQISEHWYGICAHAGVPESTTHEQILQLCHEFRRHDLLHILQTQLAESEIGYHRTTVYVASAHWTAGIASAGYLKMNVFDAAVAEWHVLFLIL